MWGVALKLKQCVYISVVGTICLLIPQKANTEAVLSTVSEIKSPVRDIPGLSDVERWLFGGYYEARDFNVVNDTIERTATAAAIFGLPAGRNRVSAEQSRNTYAVFSQVDYKP